MTIPPSAIQDLSGPWLLTDGTGEYSCPMRVPGDGITALHEARLIAEPYWGRNELRLRWIAERDWTIRRMVDLADPGVVLAIEGLDTVATVRVNGMEVLQAANAFRTWRVDLSEVAQRGRNEITVTFHSAPKEAAARAAAQPFPVPYIHQNNPIPHGNMLRKVACDWGWDWNIALCPFGITGGIWLERAEAPRIERVAVAQEHEGGRVAVTVTAWAEKADGHPFRITFAGQTAEGLLEDGGVAVIFDVENPSFWWPAGMGPQTLYDLEVQIGGDVARRRIGLRRIELVTKPDAAGLSFGFRVNGRPVFAKGANWIPTDALAGRITEAATRDLLQSAVDANMNMIRVWGGGRYEPDSFYDACDKLGLMVWQDFMFSCNLYPSTPDFLAEVEAEVRENVARIHHHACLALWCGDNELIGALTWFEESRKDRDRYLVSYDRLNRTIETALKATDPTANWWPSSPSPGYLNFRDAWHEDGSGDMHFWSVWHEGKPFEHYRDVAPRFCSEFGFQSYPSMDVIRRFAGPEDWNIASPVLESHQRNNSPDGGPGGNPRIAATMFRYFRWPERFEDFVWLSQLQQGLAIKTAVTDWRAKKPHCQGALYWQLNDTWPVCSWSSLDHGGGWKVLHHMARSFFAPVTVSAVPGPEGIALVGVNDRPEPVRLTVTAYATQMSGAAREIGRGQGTLGEKAERLLLVPHDALGEQEVLTFGWEASDGSKAGDIFAPRPWKAYDLPEPGLQHKVERDGNRWTLAVTSRAMAFFVTAEANRPGRWDRNAVHIGPGVTSRLTFTPEEDGREPRFILRHLQGATAARPDQRTS